jgi:T4 bacteriophage base plate protein
MPLPIVETPKYTVTIPSTKKTVEIRPYLVKEEKVLMIALESSDSKSILQAVKDVVRACTFEKVNPNDLSIVDLEYIFLKLRAVSVGETANVQLKCQNESCGQMVETAIDLNSIETTRGADVSNKIQLTDKVGVIMQPITVKALNRLDAEGKPKSEAVMQMIAASIEAIYDENVVHRSEDQTPEDLTKFIDSLSSSHLNKIRQWIEAQPKLSKDVEYTCKKCGKPSKLTLNGLQAFFA